MRFLLFTKKREEFQRMSAYIEKFPVLLGKYKEIRKKIKNEPEIYMRGHDAYDYMKYYLKKEKEILFDDIEKTELYKTIMRFHLLGTPRNYALTMKSCKITYWDCILQILFSSYQISLSLNQSFVAKIRSISISSPCHFYFVLYCFI